MRVLLIRPFSIVFTKPYFTIRPPINLGYLSGYLKNKGHEVRILDFGLRKDIGILTNTLKDFEPHVVGINAFTPNVLDGFELVKIVKSISSKYVTVIGGPHSTSIPEDTLEACKELDYIVIGEGEVTLLELCDKLEKKSDINQVAGLCYRQNGKIARTGYRPLIAELDSLPFPDRDSIIQCYQKLTVFDHNLRLSLRNVLELITSRGCTAFCTFCTVHRAFTEKTRSLRLRSADNVLREIDLFKSKYDIKHVSFLDDSFTINRERIKKILYGLKEMKLSWNCDTRVNLVDRDLIHEMVESGCKKISIGVESGSEKVLKLINKNITVEQVRNVFLWCHEAKLETIEANFLIGSHPDETMQDINETRKLIKELTPQRILVSIITPFPGTKVREQMLERNLIFSNDWRKYILMNDEPPPWRTTYFSSEELKSIQNMIIAEFYFSFKNIITNLKYIKSFSLFKTYSSSGLDIAKGYFISKIKHFVRLIFKNIFTR